MKSESQDSSPVRVAVMGVTGSGKSTFIRAASQLDEVKVGHGWESCTAIVEPFDFTYKGRKITLIDTPGFNDTNKTETEVLREIADWLDSTYRNPPHQKLNGLIYVQSILDPRMYGSSLRNLKMFKDLCGLDPMKNVTLVTTRWAMVRMTESEDKASQNEIDLETKEELWAPMMEMGAKMRRFQDSTESALEILDLFLKKDPVVLQIQSELVDHGRNLIETSAGHTVNEEILQLQKKYAAELEQVQKEMEVALQQKDKDVQMALEKAKQEWQRKIDRIAADQEMLQYERRSEARRWSNEMQSIKAFYEKKMEQLSAQGDLDFDATVQKLRANDGKLRKEQRVAMHQEIDEMKKKPKSERTGVKLILALLPAVGSVVLALLGLSPIGLFGC
ncbi:P-loop containing nucleoside triphosphate hydrolase protein [Polychaeton citri CBS 116435]|uniref:P-loop containing nucleoside triphosphate hydrolase protein n=1 Tax=Polychaeton citri CBS 116435 TaxID=1314669 RepID=A0A9P4UP73_9PEZI|nr:P-loop containing nucleoside triphosphate hydrolase protein [Polychaeton citri CBS 116435]